MATEHAEGAGPVGVSSLVAFIGNLGPAACKPNIMGWESMNFPDDANGDVLRRMQNSGMVLAKAHDFEFFHLLPGEREAGAMASGVKSNLSPQSVKIAERGPGVWEAECVIQMLPTHSDITAVENLLDRIPVEHGGISDGWAVMQEH